LIFKAWAKLTIVLWVSFLLVILVSGFIVSGYFQAFAKKNYEIQEVIVEIPMGSSLLLVSKILAEAHVVNSARKFYWYVRIARLDSHKFQAGFYKFFGTTTHAQVADRLLSGFDPAYKLTFKEGESLKELSEKLLFMGIDKEDFLTTAQNANIDSVPEGISVEGHLFPDTYYFSKKDSPLSIINKMNKRLYQKLTPDILERIRELNTSIHEVLTLASIVEKETGHPDERFLIASVYHNRIKKGMRLQADPTVIYGIKDYDGKIRKKDLLKIHPYNTYKIKGLPPGPIASAGIDSIRAVLWPESSEYLYFVSKNDGTHIFCKDLSCHNRAVRTWQIDYFKKTALK
jgi:UPF0755 protein